MTSNPNISDATPHETPSEPPPSVFRVRTRLMAGVSIIAPIWITGFVLWKLFDWADGFSRPLVKPFAAFFGNPDWYYSGIGFVITIVILYGVGTIVTNVLGRRIWAEAREALERLPVVRTIYSPVRQLMETMTSPTGAGFKKVVLFEYPRRGTWTLGFLAGDVPFTDDRPSAHSIFIPTAPNPTTGFMLIVQPEDIKHTDLTVEAAFQMIVSAGVAVPLALRLPASVSLSDHVVGVDSIHVAQDQDVQRSGASAAS
jgi:uncharacterized membrane protein